MMAGQRSEGSRPPASSPDLRTPVLRINQLDAFELDAALEQLVWAQFSQCFQHCRPGLLTPAEPELRSLLTLLLWRFTLYSGSATVGQALLGLRYHNARSSPARYRRLTRGQTLGLALLLVGPRWLRGRSHSLLSASPEGGLVRRGLVRSTLALVSGAAQIASLLNFLVFLRGGRHPVLAERLVGARAVFSKPDAARDVTYQYVNREILWHGFADFLIFLLPLVNARRLKTTVHSFLFGREGQEGAREGSAAWKECGLCGEWPTMPHAVGCGHVFCYYCIKGHTIADPGFTCPRCGADAQRPEPITMEVEMTEMGAR